MVLTVQQTVQNSPRLLGDSLAGRRFVVGWLAGWPVIFQKPAISCDFAGFWLDQSCTLSVDDLTVIDHFYGPGIF